MQEKTRRVAYNIGIILGTVGIIVLAPITGPVHEVRTAIAACKECLRNKPNLEPCVQQ